MISIFRKKEFLVDYLEEITDIHNHILPGIDDGAANANDTLSLLRRYKELGITSIVATPHIMNDFYPNNPETIKKAWKIITNEIANTEDLNEIKIKFAAEYLMDQSFLDIMKSEKLLTLKDNLVLIEMSYFQAPINLNQILFTLQTNGYKPVLAHPERYSFYHYSDLSKYQDLKNRGCLFQLNTLSLTPHYGINMQKIAFKLLQAGMIDFIGSDTHRIQHLEKMSNIIIPRKQLNSIVKVINKTKERF